MDVPADARPGRDRAGPHGRALTARSVLLSVLLGTDPPRLPVSLLVGTTELFGISEGTTRTALSRMVAAGELRSTDGRYEIASSRLLDRQARQARSRRAETDPWSLGDPWVQCVVVADGRRPADERAALRASLDSARLGELREGVWLRPANLGPVPDGLRQEPTLAWFRVDPDEPATLVGRLWDLGAWADTADELRTALVGLTPDLEAGDRSRLAPGFVLSAAVLRHLQADPLLPRALLPSDWPGVGLRRDYDRFDAAYRGVLRTWFDEHR